MDKIVFLFIISIFTIFPVFSQEPINLYWVGNSMTNCCISSRPGAVADLGEECSLSVYSEKSPYSWGWEFSYNDPATMHDLDTGTWNYVILQTQKRDFSEYDPYGKLWHDKIISIGAEPVIYIYKDHRGWDFLYDTLKNEYYQPGLNKKWEEAIKLATSMKFYILPAGFAVKDMRWLDPSIVPWIDSGHSGPECEYLEAFVCFCALFGVNPEKMTGEFMASGYDDIPADMRYFLRHLAWNTVVDPKFRPYYPPWQMPPLVTRIEWTNPVSFIEEFESYTIEFDAVYSDSSRKGSTGSAVFYSITPSIVAVDHYGKVYAKEPGQGKVLVWKENVKDTINILVQSSTAVLDSIVITPRTFSGYVTDGFQFTATGYFHSGSSTSSGVINDMVNWYGVAGVFDVVNGRVQRITAQGGSMYVVAEMDGVRDTVHFTMAPELSYIKRINFQESDTVFHPDWESDSGEAYTDARGYGWTGQSNFKKSTDFYGIQVNNDNFLTSSHVFPYDGSSGSNQEEEFRIKVPDGGYILKIAIGHYYNSGHTSYVIHQSDTLLKFTTTRSQLSATLKDTVFIRGDQGIFLKVYGPIQYLVIISDEGVDIDSVAKDDVAPISGTVEFQTGGLRIDNDLLAYPNPFNPWTFIKLSLKSKSYIKLNIFNSAGKLVREIHSGYLEKGIHRFIWNGRDCNGRNVASGTYLLRLENGNKLFIKSIVLMR